MRDPLRQLIREVILSEKIRQLPGAPKFRWNEFVKLETWSALKYAKDRLKFLGGGSSRLVFLLSSSKALKIAAGPAGRAQNEQEVDVTTAVHSPPYLAKVLDFDPEFEWVVSELVKAVPSYQFDDFYNTPEYQFIYNALTNRGLSGGDLQWSEQWGKKPDGSWAVLDYGLTRDIWEKFYYRENIFFVGPRLGMAPVKGVSDRIKGFILPIVKDPKPGDDEKIENFLNDNREDLTRAETEWIIAAWRDTIEVLSSQ